MLAVALVASLAALLAPAAAVAGTALSDIERDLRLEIALDTPRRIRGGERVGVTLRLRNRSRTRTHAVVEPGDGSEIGWREPHVFFTAERETAPGTWVPVATAPYARCGLYAPDWQTSIVSLAPGRSIALSGWLADPSVMLDLRTPGRVRVRAHYAYGAGARTRGPTTPPAQLAGVPAFEIVSRPITITIVD
jgi:hypothetical protein